MATAGLNPLPAYRRNAARATVPLWLFGEGLRVLAFNPPAGRLAPDLFGVPLRLNDLPAFSTDWTQVLKQALAGEHWRLERQISDHTWYRLTLEPKPAFRAAVEMRGEDVSEEKNAYILSRMREALRRLLADMETVDDENLPSFVLERLAAMSGAEFSCLVVEDENGVTKKSRVSDSFFLRNCFTLKPYHFVDGKISDGDAFEFLRIEYASSVGYEAMVRLDGRRKLLLSGQKFGKKGFSQPFLEEIVAAVGQKLSGRLLV
jgi:hypothetical protein